MPARLTVVIPLYNSERSVAETIESVRRQTMQDWECIVVNDGSTDAGPAIVESIIAEEPRIRMVSQTNRGLGGARNRGIEECRTELIHFLDADDWMSPRGYEWLSGAVTSTGAAYGGYELCDDRGQSLGRQSPASAPMVGLDELLEWNRAATHAHMFTRDAIGDYRFDERLNCVEDYDMWLRMALGGQRWTAVERIVAGYRLRPDSMSKNFAAMCGTYEMVVRKAFMEAEAIGRTTGGPAGAAMDLSERRFRRVTGNMSLTYATMDAILDPSPNKGRAARMYDHAARPDRISPSQAASTASVALLFGACTAPDVNGLSERRWLSPLRQWWVRCADEGWMDYQDIDPAFAEFARKIVHPDAIAASMFDAAGVGGRSGNTDTPVVVIGLERNGRRLLRRAASAGLRVLGFDDFSHEAELSMLSAEERSAWGQRVQVCRDRDEFAQRARARFTSAAWLIGPMEGTALTAAASFVSAARPSRIQRWSDHRESIGAGYEARIRDALSYQRAKAG